MKANKVGDAVVVRSGHLYIPGTVVRTTKTQTVVSAGGQEYKFSGVVAQSASDTLYGVSHRVVCYLDVEFANRQEANFKREQQEQAAAEAAAKAEKIAAEDKAIEDLRMFACVLKNWKLEDAPDASAEQKAENRKQEFAAYEVGSDWLDAHKTLVAFAREVVLYPARAFEWGEREMQAAAQREIAEGVMHLIKNGKMPLSALSEMVDSLKERLLRNEWRSNSSSAAHNAMQGYRAEAASRFISSAAWKVRGS